MSAIGLAIATVGTACVLYPFVRDVIGMIRHRRPEYGNLLTAIGCALMAVSGIIPPDWPWAAWFAFLAAVNAIIWWRRRRKKRRALAAIGAKALAIRAAMVATMRERAKPRPVLKPQRSRA